MKRCCLVSDADRRSNVRIQNAFFESKQTECQFTSCDDIYEHNGQSYCIFHLPYEAKKRKDLNQLALDKLECYIRQGETNFNFVCLEGLKSEFKHNRSYAFIGAWIWSMYIENSLIECLDIRHSKIQGINKISKSDISQIYIKNCQINSFFEISEIRNEIDLILIENNHFHFDERNLGLDANNHGFILNKINCKNFRLKKNKFEIPMKIYKGEFKLFELINNTFFVCPIFFKDDFKNISELVLPEEKDFNFKKICNVENDTLWEDQYRKFREIYNITKYREMYTEQSCYFTLMQKCKRKIKKLSLALRATSYLYGLLSDYGQSISKPLIALLLLFAMNSTFFWMIGVPVNNSIYLSVTQIKPYSILFDEEPRKLISNLCKKEKKTFYSISEIIFREENEKNNCDSLIEYNNGWLIAFWSVFTSTLYLAILACLGLALRWNFRKA